jgi:hypothetical protein
MFYFCFMKEEASKSQIQYIWINNKEGDVGIPKDYFETICQTAKNNPDKDVVIVYDDKNGGGDFVKKLNQAKLGNIKAYTAKFIVDELIDTAKADKTALEQVNYLNDLYKKEEKPAIKKNHLQILSLLSNRFLRIITIYLDCGVTTKYIDLTKYPNNNFIRNNYDDYDRGIISTKVLLVKPDIACIDLFSMYVETEKGASNRHDLIDFKEKDSKFYDMLYTGIVKNFFHSDKLDFLNSDIIHGLSWLPKAKKDQRFDHEDNLIASDTRKIKTKEELQEVYKNSNLSNDDKLLKELAKQKPVLIDDYTMINNGKATNEESKNAYFLSSLSGKLSKVSKIQLN